MVVVNFTGGWGQYMQLELWSDWQASKPEQNATLVNVQVRLISVNGGTIYQGNGAKTLWLNVGGIEEHYNIDPAIAPNQRRSIFGKDYLIPHNADGTKTVTISCEYVVGLGGYDRAKAQFSIKLKDLIKISKGQNVTGDIGSPVTLSVERNGSDYLHSAEVVFGNWKKTVTGYVRFDTSFSWTPPLELCNQIPDTNSGVGSIIYITYQNGREVGKDIKTITLNVPDSVKPTLGSINVTDENPAINKLLSTNIFASTISRLKVGYVNPAGAYGSTISSYSATIVDQPYSSYNEDGVIGNVTMVGKAKVKATVTDSRGRTSDPKIVDIEFLDYFLPQISFDAKRVGTNGEKIQVTRNIKVSPLPMNGTPRNTMSVSFKVAPFGSKNYVADNGPATASFTSISELVNSSANLGSDYRPDMSYVIIGTVSDKFTSSEFRVEVATRSVIMSMDQNGIGIGKIRERGMLDVAGDIYSSGLLNANGIKIANKNIQQYPITSLDGRIQDVRFSRKDLNTITETGLYMVFGKHSGAKNGPDTQKQGMLEVFALNDKELFQRHMDNRLNIWARWRDSNNHWTNWEQIHICEEDALASKKPTYIHMAFTMPWDMPATITRSGNLVTIHIPRIARTISQQYENQKCNEILPEGFRPTNQATLILSLNDRSSFLGNTILHLNPDGIINITTGITQTAIYEGTITYITNDPFPSVANK